MNRKLSQMFKFLFYVCVVATLLSIMYEVVVWVSGGTMQPWSTFAVACATLIFWSFHRWFAAPLLNEIVESQKAAALATAVQALKGDRTVTVSGAEGPILVVYKTEDGQQYQTSTGYKSDDPELALLTAAQTVGGAVKYSVV